MDKAALALVLIVATALLADGAFLLLHVQPWRTVSTAISEAMAAATNALSRAIAAVTTMAMTVTTTTAVTTTAAIITTTTAATTTATTPTAATTTAVVTTTTTASSSPSETKVDWWSAGINWEGSAQGAAARFCACGIQVVRYGKADGWSVYLVGFLMPGYGDYVLMAGRLASTGRMWWIGAENWWGVHGWGSAFPISNGSCIWLFVELRNGSLYYGYALLNTSSVEAAYKNATWFFSATTNATEIAAATASLGSFADGDWIQFNGTVYAALYVEVNGTWIPAQAKPGWGGVVAYVAHAWIVVKGNCAAISWPEPAQPVCP